jgi:membrane associated rhomboid family serine protease
MMPLGDDNTLRKTTPVVTYVLIVINIFIFLVEMAFGEQFIRNWAFIPSRFASDPVGNIPTVFTSMFMHGGWGHLIGNMLYLWIFGDNVEDFLGKIKYLLFYLTCGVVATFSQMFFNPDSNLPNVGASGAIAGVLGAYILYFPKEKVRVLIGYNQVALPAIIVIGFWFLLQFMSGFASTHTQGDVGGVAYMAHVGGFVSGFVMAFILRVFLPKNKN